MLHACALFWCLFLCFCVVRLCLEFWLVLVSSFLCVVGGLGAGPGVCAGCRRVLVCHTSLVFLVRRSWLACELFAVSWVCICGCSLVLLSPLEETGFACLGLFGVRVLGLVGFGSCSSRHACSLPTPTLARARSPPGMCVRL